MFGNAYQCFICGFIGSDDYFIRYSNVDNVGLCESCSEIYEIDRQKFKETKKIIYVKRKDIKEI